MQDWLTQSQRSQALAQAASKAAPPASATTVSPGISEEKPAAPTKRKLSYKEQRELEQLPALIDALEAEQASLRTQLDDPQIYAQDNAKALALHARDAEIEEALMQALERWESLSSI